MISVCIDVVDGAMKLLWQKREGSERGAKRGRSDREIIICKASTNYQSEGGTSL